jgi:hypothetical protein
MESSASPTTLLLRFLSQPPSIGNNTAGNNTDIDGQGGSPAPEGSGREAYEFMAFLLWYLFLVLCCVIPTCCAYRRRRLIEARISQQQVSLEQMQEQQNIFMLSNLHHLHHRGGAGAGGILMLDLNSEQAKAERTRRITEELKSTTFVSLYIEHGCDLL